MISLNEHRFSWSRPLLRVPPWEITSSFMITGRPIHPIRIGPNTEVSDVKNPIEVDA
jgi:hypothetical protein